LTTLWKKTILRERQSEPGLVAFYDICPGNGVVLFLQLRSPYRVTKVQAVNRSVSFAKVYIFYTRTVLKILFCIRCSFHNTL